MDWLVITLLVLVGLVVIVIALGADDTTMELERLGYELNDKGEIIAFLPCSYCRQHSEEKQCPYCGAGENRRG